jgi:hypothetical protein
MCRISKRRIVEDSAVVFNRKYDCRERCGLRWFTNEQIYPSGEPAVRTVRPEKSKESPPGMAIFDTTIKPHPDATQDFTWIDALSESNLCVPSGSASVRAGQDAGHWQSPLVSGKKLKFSY